MDQPIITRIQTTYDRVAAEYAQRIFGELQHKPLDRQLLDRFCASVRDKGPICDFGCGPGHVARYLHEHGADVCGIDLSEAMVAQARRLNPDIPFHQGNMLALDVADGAWAGIVAFYSLIHIPPAEVEMALREMRRTLRPNGLLLLAFHVGDQTIHLDEWWGQSVSIDAYFFRTDDMRRHLTAAGFAVEEVIERPPYDGVEFASQRAYIFARRLGD